jgi:hypothetical protein
MSEQKSKKTTKMDLSKWQLLSDKGYCGKTGISLKENFHQSKVIWCHLKKITSSVICPVVKPLIAFDFN